MPGSDDILLARRGEDDRVSTIAPADDSDLRSRDQNTNKKRQKRDVHGWVVLDKPIGMTSTHAVAVIKRLFSAKRAGHAGTLDPLASGCLPIALGEATKTVPFVVDGRKTYVFTVRWGEERDTDDAEGRVVNISESRPEAAAIQALLPRFVGTIEQVPPRFSAIKIGGERAYDLARDGETVEITPRAVTIYRLELLETPDPDHAVLAAECGKGTYVRALARDLGRMLGAFGHVSALRRSRVSPFRESDMISLERLDFCVIERPLARETSPICYCRSRPRWTTSRRWPLARQMRQGSTGAKPFCCVDGTLPSSAARSRSLRADSSWQLPRSTAARSSPNACSI